MNDSSDGRKKRVKGLIRDLTRLLAKHGNLEVTYSVPGHTFYQDRPIQSVKYLEQGAIQTIDLS